MAPEYQIPQAAILTDVMVERFVAAVANVAVNDRKLALGLLVLFEYVQ